MAPEPVSPELVAWLYGYHRCIVVLGADLALFPLAWFFLKARQAIGLLSTVLLERDRLIFLAQFSDLTANRSLMLAQILGDFRRGGLASMLLNFGEDRRLQ